MSFVRAKIQEFLSQFGYRLAQTHLPKFIRKRSVSLVLDVGANEGQFGSYLRKFGYSGRIVSFEPAASVRPALERLAALDDRWEVEPYALGDREETATMHRSENPMSSSLLEILPTHLDAAPDSHSVGCEQIHVRRLDSVFDRYHREGDVTLLKLDTQGYEMPALLGASKCIDRIHGIQVEVSLTPLYKGQALLEEMFSYLRKLGFTPVDIEPMFRNRATSDLLQCDALFFRDSCASVR